MTSATTDPRIGTELAGYRIEALIGRGGMSTVYRAEDLTLGRKVALKLISPELAEDEGFRERFRAEWRLAASIDHPNVIPIHEAGESEGTLFIAMRYVEGTDLKALLAEGGALEPKRALNLVSQVGAGLDAAHDRGLVHRDVKPSNVLISFDRDGEHAYLADFGLTKPASNEQEARESIQLSGTTDYVSPEQIADGTADARSDIYALGALLYESLTGEVPYPRDRKLQVLFAHVNDPPPKPREVKPELPEGIDAVIATAMAKEPNDRYGTGAELAEAAVAAFPEARRPRWQIAAVVAVLLLAIAAAVALATVLLTGGSEQALPGGTTDVTTHSVQRIDPFTNVLAATIELDFLPEDLAAGDAGVWLLNRSDRTLSRIDPATNAVVETVSFDVTEELNPFRIAVGEDAVSITFGPRAVFADPQGSVWTYNTEAQQFVESVSFDGLLPSQVLHLAFGDIWLLRGPGGAPGNDLVRYTDGSVEEPVASIPLELNELRTVRLTGPSIAHGQGRLWVIGPRGDFGESDNAVLWEIDPEIDEVVGAVELPLATIPDPFAVGEEFIWIPAPVEDKVMQFNPATNRVEGEITVGRQPQSAVLGHGALWVANTRNATVSRIDPETLDVTTIEVGASPVDIAVTEDGVWVSVRP